MKVLFIVLRQNPDQVAQIHSYLLDVEPVNTVLDCLNLNKWEHDGTLAFRKNCRNTICGSCSMRINGRAALACKENIGSEVARLEKINLGKSDVPEMTIAPMGNFPVIKDLVVDMKQFWNNLEEAEHYVSTEGRSIPEREFLQTPEERAELNQNGNCILCGACYSECNALEVNPEFVGPHALAKAQRMVGDSRDAKSEQRLEQYAQGISGVWGCTRCFNCNSVCPMEVAPLDQITQIKQDILERKDKNASRAIRHRKVMVDLVKQGGWVDERKFGLFVVGNYFRDIEGLLSLGPLGLRMLTRGKFPLTFEPSEDVAAVRSLIESVEQLEKKS
ncbi:MAG: succinate dehydrogenase/fumarate reductase iron-sulfur subunit [Microcoleaceae cyanobacterium]